MARAQHRQRRAGRGAGRQRGQHRLQRWRGLQIGQRLQLAPQRSNGKAQAARLHPGGPGRGGGGQDLGGPRAHRAQGRAIAPDQPAAVPTAPALAVVIGRIAPDQEPRRGQAPLNIADLALAPAQGLADLAKRHRDHRLGARGPIGLIAQIHIMFEQPQHRRGQPETLGRPAQRCHQMPARDTLGQA
ncbi:MAG: hypothetical protein AAGE13_08240 [Pseudomonadota bacterium]